MMPLNRRQALRLIAGSVGAGSAILLRDSIPMVGASGAAVAKPLHSKGSDLIYRLDGKEVYRNVGEGDKYPEPMFAILNFAKITDNPMEGEWVMEVDWVKHEKRK